MRARSRVGDQKDDQREDHEVGVEQDQHARVVEIPFASDTSSCFGHSPTRSEQGEKLPMRPVQIFNMRKARQQQARDERAEREHDAARE